MSAEDFLDCELVSTKGERQVRRDAHGQHWYAIVDMVDGKPVVVGQPKRCVHAPGDRA